MRWYFLSWKTGSPLVSVYMEKLQSCMVSGQPACQYKFTIIITINITTQRDLAYRTLSRLAGQPGFDINRPLHRYYRLSCSGLITSQLKALTQNHMPDFNSALPLQGEYKLIRNVTILVPSCTRDMKKNVFYVTLSVYPQQAG